VSVMRASDLLVRCLKNEGVTRIFGIPGEENLEVMDSLSNSDMEFVLARHETSAAFMATIAARLTGEVEVCLSTLGPGATNMLTGIGDAFLTHAPVIALTGQVDTSQAYHPRKQYIDLVSLYGPVTKASYSIRNAERMPKVVRDGFCIARRERPGPVHIELPQDIARQDVVAGPLLRTPVHIPDADERGIAAVTTRINEAKRPLILVGQGVVRNGASSSLRDFARRANIPVIHTWMGNGVMPFDDPLSLHTVGLRTQQTSLQAFKDSDLVIAVGFDAIEFQPRYWNFGSEVVNVSACPPDMMERFEPKASAVGELPRTLDSLTRRVGRKENWAGDIKLAIEKELEAVPDDIDGIKPQRAVRAIRDSLGRKDIVVCDVGAHLLWMTNLYRTYAENTLIVSNGLISMGMGIPGAIGAKYVHPERNCVAVCGDGGAMMTIAELETAVRTGKDIVVVVFNDSSLGLIKAKQERRYGRTFGVEMRSPDMVKLAGSMGADGYRVSDEIELMEALSQALGGGTALIDVAIDGTENARLLG
jgi:acetolactate synthase-1/2/3 large subunit